MEVTIKHYFSGGFMLVVDVDSWVIDVLTFQAWKLKKMLYKQDRKRLVW